MNSLRRKENQLRFYQTLFNNKVWSWNKNFELHFKTTEKTKNGRIIDCKINNYISTSLKISPFQMKF